MSCPVCGAKMLNNQVCRYCPTVTADRVMNASNKRAKLALRNKTNDEVHTSSYLPSDVSKKKLWILLALFGIVGVHNFYVGKYVKGFFCSLSWGLASVFVMLQMISEANNWGAENGLQVIISVFAFCSAIAFLLWIGDVFALLFHNYKVPVVLKDEEVIVLKGKKQK